MRTWLLAGICGWVAALQPVGAQMYGYEPPAPRAGDAWNVYFGAVKDTRGARLPGVTVSIDADNITFNFVTDLAGRFRGEVPQSVTPDKVTIRCDKGGYTQVRVDKRPPPDKGATPIEVDCTLQQQMPPATRDLRRLKELGDLDAQRAYMWDVYASLMAPQGPAGESGDADRVPLFATWHGAVETYALRAREPRSLSRLAFLHGPAPAGEQVASAPLITALQFNEPAYRHVQTYALYRASELGVAVAQSNHDRYGRESIPAFPEASMLVKSIWWPVAGAGLSPLPVWDESANPARRDGNPYPTWARLVVVDCAGGTPGRSPLDFGFYGRTFKAVRQVTCADFVSLKATAEDARQLMTDPQGAKLSLMVLGRAFREGDRLVLIGMHIATRALEDWTWGTLWWHDRADQGSYAAGRPEGLRKPLRHYLMNVSFDPVLPRELDGSPHIAYNPWLEGRFPDVGNGGGTRSNCVSCHQRASFPATAFIDSPRGPPQLGADIAFAPSRKSTSLLWSLALHAH